MKTAAPGRCRAGLSRGIITGLSVLFVICSFCPAEPAEVLIIGDAKLRPVAEIVREINGTLVRETIVKPARDVRDGIRDLVAGEGIRAVVALGPDAVAIAELLDESVPVVYGLIIKPPETKRRNVTGIYMATPVSSYLEVIRKYFPDIRNIGFVHEAGEDGHYDAVKQPKVRSTTASNPYEFIREVRGFNNTVDAIILLPERNLITDSSMKEAYLFSFKNNVPLMGISEKHVKEGSLLSLVFDLKEMGRQIGTFVGRVLDSGSTNGLAPSPPDKFNLYVNVHTARTMGLEVPEALLQQAGRVYP